jgi:hypothetical protein
MPKKTQIDKFKEAARKTGAADDEAAFNEAVKQIAEAQRDPNADFGTEAWKKRHKTDRD